MNLVIRAVMLDDQPLAEPLLGIFDSRGGTIGRAQANTLALPDPECRLSRLQAEVSSGADGYTIRNAGSTSTILVNDRSLVPGDARRLAHRDELRLGGYLLRVLLEDERPGTGTPRAHVAVDARTVGFDMAGDQRTDPRYMVPRPGAGGATTPSNAPAPRPAAPSGPALGFGDTSALSQSNPFADLVAPEGAASRGAAQAAVDDPFAFINAPSAPAAARTVDPATPRPVLADDFDPFADLDGTARAAPPSMAVAPVRRGGSDSSDLLAAVGANSGRPVGLDEAFGLPGTKSSSDPLADFMAGTPATASGQASATGSPSTTSTDPFAMFGSVADAGVPAGPRRAAASNHTAELQGAYVPPRVMGQQAAGPQAARPAVQALGPPPAGRTPAAIPVAPALNLAPPAVQPARPRPGQGLPTAQTLPFVPVAQVTPVMPAAPVARVAPAQAPVQRPAAAPTAGQDVLWSAFCQGAGVSLAMPQGLTPEHMHLLGQLLREAIGGTRQLLAQRETERRDANAGAGTAGTRGHNPMAVTADTQVALEQMLLPPVRGFLSGPAAMQDAMQNLVAHAGATSAGTRAAVGAALAVFEPRQVEALLADKALLAINRKTKIWEQYQLRYDALRGEARERYRAQMAAAFKGDTPPPRR